MDLCAAGANFRMQRVDRQCRNVELYPLYWLGFPASLQPFEALKRCICCNSRAM